MLKKFILSISLLFLVTYSYSQAIKGSSLKVAESIAIRDSIVDTIYSGTIPNINWIENFLIGGNPTNGLSKVGDDILWGGTLTQNTFINGDRQLAFGIESDRIRDFEVATLYDQYFYASQGDILLNSRNWYWRIEGEYIRSDADSPREDTLATRSYIRQLTSDSVESPYKSHTLSVAKSGGTFDNIVAAIDSINITGSDSINRWTISLYPGVYVEDNSTIIKIPEFVALRSVGGIGSAVIEPTTSGDLFEMSNITSIYGLQIQNVDSGSCITYSDFGSIKISEIIFQDCDTAITINSPLSLIDFSNSFFANGQRKIIKGLNLLAGNVVVNQVSVAGIDTVQNPFWISGSNAILTLSNATSFSPNIDTFLFAQDTSRVVVTSTSIANAKNGLFSFTGSQVIYNGDSHFNITGKYTKRDSSSVLAGYANNDDNDAALVIEGQELHVGDAAEGYEVCLGKGDSYSDDISVWTFDGTSTYVDYSDSVRYVDGYGIEFPNVNVGACIYIASSVSDTMMHAGIKLSMIDSVTIGSGEIILEYWDGSTWVEENAMVSAADIPYSPYAKEYFQQIIGTHIRYNINLDTSIWRVSDDMSAGIDRRYIRYRITSAITTSPRIDQIKLHPDRWEANVDGFVELFGTARNSQILALTIGGGKATSGNLGDQTIWVDENIGVAHKENNFNANGDMLGYPINFPDNIDTGSPINLVYSGRSATSQTVTYTVRWKIVKPEDPLYISEPSASGTSGSFVINQTLTSGLNELMFAEIDVSDAIPNRQDGFGDQLWITLERTTATDDFALTNIGAEYWTWSEGGHK